MRMIGVDHLILSVPVCFPQGNILNPLHPHDLATLDMAVTIPVAQARPQTAQQHNHHHAYNNTHMNETHGG
jgi:hypothetical protein